MRYRRWIAAAALFLAALAASGCSREAGTKLPQETVSSLDEAEEMQQSENGAGTEESPASGNSETLVPERTDSETQKGEGQNRFDYSYPGFQNQNEGSKEPSDSENGNSDDEINGPAGELTEDEDIFVQQKIVVATDLHYLAEALSGNRGPAFMEMVSQSDGRVLHYSWEILDAFLEDMLRERPRLVVLSGDLTLNGEKKSHEELAEKLSVLTENGIEVAVIPGNHDINHLDAREFTEGGPVETEITTAEEFAAIYADCGYTAADSRDPHSLSYLYKLDDYYWLLMLDSCQYEPTSQIGGMIRMGTYDWMEEVLEESWEQGAQVITVTHHNLLDQSGVSKEFYDNCTIEHHEELLELLAGYDVRLHFSGHLHVQHYMQEEDTGIWEIITGSLVMAPCQYSVLRIWNDGTLQYDAQKTDVSGWAKRSGYRNRDLADFERYSEQFLGKLSFEDAVEDLTAHFENGKFMIESDEAAEMANFYATLCVYYFGGRMHEITDWIKKEKAYKMWMDIEYVSELSSFLANILADEAKDFAHLSIPY